MGSLAIGCGAYRRGSYRRQEVKRVEVLYSSLVATSLAAVYTLETAFHDEALTAVRFSDEMLR